MKQTLWKLAGGIALAALVTGWTGCATFDWFKKKKHEKPPEPTIKDMSGDMGFQSYVGILRKAVAKRDYATLASMMNKDFGYRWDAPPPGDNVFQYWDRNNLWSELQLVLNEKFVPKGDFMVAPPAFALDPEAYRGFRVGIRSVGGSWKFAYFVGDEP